MAMFEFLSFVLRDAVCLSIEPLTDPSLDVVNAPNKLIGPSLEKGPMVVDDCRRCYRVFVFQAAGTGL